MKNLTTAEAAAKIIATRSATVTVTAATGMFTEGYVLDSDELEDIAEVFLGNLAPVATVVSAFIPAGGHKIDITIDNDGDKISFRITWGN